MFDYLKKDYLRFWQYSLIISIVINFALFSLMPLLINTEHRKSESHEIFEKINFIRLKKVKKDQTHKKQKTIVSPKKPVREKIKNKINKLLINQVVNKFEINSRLPASIFAVNAPVMKVLDISGIKSIFGVGELDRPLTPLVNIPPIYPIRARQRGIEGWVKVEFIVNREGGVRSVKILKAVPKDIFETSAKRCVYGWKFLPGTVDGVAVETLVSRTIKYVFER